MDALASTINFDAAEIQELPDEVLDAAMDLIDDSGLDNMMFVKDPEQDTWLIFPNQEDYHVKIVCANQKEINQEYLRRTNGKTNT